MGKTMICHKELKPVYDFIEQSGSKKNEVRLYPRVAKWVVDVVVYHGERSRQVFIIDTYNSVRLAAVAHDVYVEALHEH